MRQPDPVATLVWTFHDDAERKTYRRAGQSSVVSASRYLFLPVLCFLSILALGMVSRTLLALSGVALLAFGVSQLAGRRPRIVALEARLQPKRLVLAERYDHPAWRPTRTLASHDARSVKALSWVADGCFVDFKGGAFRERPLTLPMGIFSSQQSIDALYRWAEEHNITIEGVPPLPGAYVRPIEDRRGL